ncbi:hypothetical protein DMUE_5520 [Dictyocoela muelleri]|nr:hypothetical protein DMUE_5520 [Dictyocoela muelleri]
MKYDFIPNDKALEIIRSLPSGNEQQETIKFYIKQYCGEPFKTDELKAKLETKNLFEFEIQQLLKIKPRNLLCLQLIIDEMEERFSIDELNEILSFYDNL